jgi:glycosyltransferase involved in cell wall biosynthesis
MKPLLSVVIPCRNEARFLGRCLDSILAAEYPRGRMEVLVVDGGSTDGTRELIRARAAADARVRLVDNPQATTPWALNHGIDRAAGDVIARVDAHAAVSPGYFALCVGHLTASGADAVGGAMRTVPRESGCFAGPIVAALSHPFGVGNSHFRIGSRTGSRIKSIEPRWVDTVFGGCWRREVFARVGRFDTNLRRSQDMEFSLRLKAAGGRTLLVPEARIDYYARARMAAFWRHNFENGEWAILPFVHSPVIPVSPRHLIPLLFVMALAAGAVLLPWTGWPLAVAGGAYAAANLAASVSVAAQLGRPSYAVRMPIVFLSLHVSYGAGSVSGLVRAAALWWKAAPSSNRSKDNPCLPQS